MVIFSEFIKFRNEQKYLYTAGPASLVEENLLGMRPCFGRGDKDYSEIENSVLNQLKNLSDHKEIVRLQGSASLALEIMALNFLYGNVLIISTGFYSDRLIHLSNNAKLISNNIITKYVGEFKDGKAHGYGTQKFVKLILATINMFHLCLN